MRKHKNVFIFSTVALHSTDEIPPHGWQRSVAPIMVDDDIMVSSAAIYIIVLVLSRNRPVHTSAPVRLGLQALYNTTNFTDNIALYNIYSFG